MYLMADFLWELINNSRLRTIFTCEFRVRVQRDNDVISSSSSAAAAAVTTVFPAAAAAAEAQGDRQTEATGWPQSESVVPTSSG